MIRRFGKPPSPRQDYVRRMGAYALLPRNGKLLVTCQSDPDPDFQLPGGGVDSGESPVAALHREVLEETGWRIGDPRRIGAFRRFAYMPEYDLWAEKICVVYLARPTLRLGSPSETHHSAHWVTAREASQMLGNAGDRHFAGLWAETA